jgi:hypothetical protein
MEIDLWLGEGSDAHALWSGPLAPGATWKPDQGYCSRLRTALPTEAAAGSYPMVLRWTSGASQQETTLGTLQIGPSTRRFDLPPLERTANALLTDEQGGQIRLAGAAQIAQEGGRTLNVTLVWQEVSRVDGNYTAFVHLVDDDGTIVAQSDSVPAGGYATNRWVPDEVVADAHRLVLPADLAPGVYRLVAGMYEPIGGRRLDAVNADGYPVSDNHVALGEVTLAP